MSICFLSSQHGYVTEDLLILSKYVKIIQSTNNMSVDYEGRITGLNHQ